MSRCDPMGFVDEEAEDAAWPAATGAKTMGGETSERLSPIDPTTLHSLAVPSREWLVLNWIPMVRASGLYGAGGEGKTLLAQMLATACALDKLWLSLPVRRCNSLLVFCEDDLDEMHRRQDEINRHYGCSFSDLGAMRWLPQLGADNIMMNFDSGRPVLTGFFDRVLHVALEQATQLIVVDTLADVFAGNENDRGQARAFAQAALGHLARETGAAVVVLAHPSRTGMNSGSGESGSTAWIGTFRSQLYLATPKLEAGEPPHPDARALTRVKSNGARRNETIELRWQDGVFIRTGSPDGILGSIERRNAEQVFLTLLDNVTGEGRYVSDKSRAYNYAPRLFGLRPDRERFRQADFERAMQALFASRQLSIGTDRSPDRKVYQCILRATAGGAGASL